MATERNYSASADKIDGSDEKLNADNRAQRDHGADWERIEDAADDIDCPFPMDVNGGVRGKEWREWYPTVSVTAESDDELSRVDLVMSDAVLDRELNMNPDEAVALGKLLIEAGTRAEQTRSQFRAQRTTFLDRSEGDDE